MTQVISRNLFPNIQVSDVAHSLQSMGLWRLHPLYSSLWTSLATVTFWDLQRLKYLKFCPSASMRPSHRHSFPEHCVQAGLRYQPLGNPAAFPFAPSLSFEQSKFKSLFFGGKRILSIWQSHGNLLDSEKGRNIFLRSTRNQQQKTRVTFFHQKILPCVHSFAYYITALLLPSK